MLLQSAAANALDPGLGISSYSHTTWTVSDETFDGGPRALAQTNDGYLWVATEFGLVRFDGRRFLAWRPPVGSELPSMQVVALRGGSDGSLWIGTSRGLARWHQGRLTTFPELADRYVTEIEEDANGTIWVGISAGIAGNASLCSLGARGFQCDDAAGAFGRFVISLHVDRARRLWVGAATGLWQWQPDTRTRYPMPALTEIHALADAPDGSLLLALNREVRRFVDGRLDRYQDLEEAVSGLKPTALVHDRSGALWIGTQDSGMVHVARGRVTRFAREDGLSGDFVSDLLEDREGNIWVATLDGLDRFRAFAIPTISTDHGLSASAVHSVVGDPDGTIWIGALNGLNRWMGDRVVALGSPSGVPGEGAASLLRDSRGRLWVSSSRGLMYRDRDHVVRVSAMPAAHIHAMAEAHDGRIWVATQDQGLYELSDARVVAHVPPSALAGRAIRALAVDPARHGLWLGFFRGGIGYLEDGRLRATYGEDAFGQAEVTSLFFDRTHALWAATQNGLGHLASGRLEILGSKNGLPCDAIHWVAEDPAQDLWVFTACGLVRLDRGEVDRWVRDPTRSVRLTIFERHDGVRRAAHAGSYGPKVTRSADGRLLFATNSGVAVIDPPRLRSTRRPPPVHIENLLADGRSYPGEPSPELPPLVRDIRIEYTATSLTIPEAMRFKYWLEGRDRTWSEPTQRREAVYTDLPPGRYTFRVIASTHDGVWSADGARLTFSIRPALYQTNTFLFAVCGLLLTGVWLLYRMRLRRVSAQLQLRFAERLAERARIGQDLHDTLLQGFISAAMQLDTLTDELPWDDEKRSKLDRLLRRMRQAIDEGRNAVRGLRVCQDSNDLAASLAREAEELRGDQSIEIRIRVTGRVRALHPLVRDEVYRIGREALANAVRHARARRLEIQLEYGSDHVSLRIRDDGRGIPIDFVHSGKTGHWGIPGMRERAERLGASLHLRSAPAAGTELELLVPVEVAFRASSDAEATSPSFSSVSARTALSGAPTSSDRDQTRGTSS